MPSKKSQTILTLYQVSFFILSVYFFIPVYNLFELWALNGDYYAHFIRFFSCFISFLWIATVKNRSTERHWFSLSFGFIMSVYSLFFESIGVFLVILTMLFQLFFYLTVFSKTEKQTKQYLHTLFFKTGPIFFVLFVFHILVTGLICSATEKFTTTYATHFADDLITYMLFSFVVAFAFSANKITKTQFKTNYWFYIYLLFYCLFRILFLYSIDDVMLINALHWAPFCFLIVSTYTLYRYQKAPLWLGCILLLDILHMCWKSV